MIIQFSTKPNSVGCTYQLEIDTDKMQFRSGSDLFVRADITRMTKEQLNTLTRILIANEYKRR